MYRVLVDSARYSFLPDKQVGLVLVREDVRLRYQAAGLLFLQLLAQALMQQYPN